MDKDKVTESQRYLALLRKEHKSRWGIAPKERISGAISAAIFLLDLWHIPHGEEICAKALNEYNPWKVLDNDETEDQSIWGDQ